MKHRSLLAVGLALLLAACGKPAQDKAATPGAPGAPGSPTALTAAPAAQPAPPADLPKPKKTNEPEAEDKPPAQAAAPATAPAAKGDTAGFTTTASGLKYKDAKVGNGKSPKMGDKVQVLYTGKLDDGTVFDSTDKHGGQPAEFTVGKVIEGWNEGLQSMKEGGERDLVIPGNLAYGPTPPPGANIPPNATLHFNVKLLKVG